MIKKRFGRLNPLTGILLLALLQLTGSSVSSQAEVTAPDFFGSGINICTPPLQPVTLVNPTTITNCNQAGIQAALDGGGHINFACGPGPVTIPISSQLELSTTSRHRAGWRRTGHAGRAGDHPDSAQRLARSRHGGDREHHSAKSAADQRKGAVRRRDRGPFRRRDRFRPPRHQPAHHQFDFHKQFDNRYEHRGQPGRRHLFQQLL